MSNTPKINSGFNPTIPTSDFYSERPLEHEPSFPANGVSDHQFQTTNQDAQAKKILGQASVKTELPTELKPYEKWLLPGAEQPAIDEALGFNHLNALAKMYKISEAKCELMKIIIRQLEANDVSCAAATLHYFRSVYDIKNHEGIYDEQVKLFLSCLELLSDYRVSCKEKESGDSKKIIDEFRRCEDQYGFQMAQIIAEAHTYTEFDETTFYNIS